MKQTQISRLIMILIIGIIINSVSCKKGDDGLSSLVKLSVELPGENCLNGGQKIETGIDSNQNGVLDPSEVQQTEFICNGGSGSVINQLRFQVTSHLGNTSSEGTVYLQDLIEFDINNYPEMDSAILIVENAETINSSSSIIFELFDVTNNIIIFNSEVKSNNTSKTRLTSSNIISFIPDQKIDIGIKIRSEIDGIAGGSDDTYLFLFDTK